MANKVASPENEDNVIIVNRVHAGSKVILPVVGQVEVNAVGEVEVSADLGEQMVALGNGWRFVDDAAKDDDLKASINSMELPQLIEMAEQAKIDPKLYEKHKVNVVLMRRWLFKYMNTPVS